jgi:hypothetical protein
MPLGEKVPAPETSPSWGARVGTYAILNADPGFPVVDVELKLREGHLCFSYRMPYLTAAAIQVPLGAGSVLLSLDSACPCQCRPAGTGIAQSRLLWEQEALVFELTERLPAAELAEAKAKTPLPRADSSGGSDDQA